MDYAEFTAGNDDDGRRLDRVIRKFLPDTPLSKIYRSLRNGLIKINNKKQKPDYKINSSDKISIAAFLLSESSALSGGKALDESMVILRTADLLFLNKPYNLSVQKAFKDDKALNSLVESDWNFHHPKKESLSFKCGPLHRLDKKTTGLIAFSQSLQGAQAFSKALLNHKTVKTYLALTQGHLKEEQDWEDKISKEDGNKRAFHTVVLSEKGKESITHARPLANGHYRGRDVTLVEFTIYTGRTHQIRAQSAFHGFPLLGDTAYGSEKICEDQDHFLHSYKIEFTEKIEGFPQSVTCPLNEAFKKVLKTALINLPGEL